MLLDITAVSYLEGYKLLLTFENNEQKVVDLSNRLEGPIFEAVKDISVFKKVFVDKSLGTIVWPNGADKAPDMLYEIGTPHAN